jgi:hypothetical protein
MVQNERIAQFNRPSQEEMSGGGHRIREAYEMTEDMVREHPASSALVTFGLGVGLGLVLTALLVPAAPRRSWYDEHMPESLSRRNVSDMINRMLPDALARYMK